MYLMFANSTRVKNPALIEGFAATLVPLLAALAIIPLGVQAADNIVVQPTAGEPTLELKLPGTATAPGVIISYVPGVNASDPNTALLQLPRSQDVWQWQSVNNLGVERLQMSLKADNSLELVNSAGQVKIALKPNGTGGGAPGITIDGLAVLTTATGLTPAVANATYAPISPSIFTVGPNSITGGIYGFAAGGWNEIYEESAVALGERNWIRGKWGFAAGMQNQVTGVGAGAIGYQNLASGWGSFAAGVNATSSGANSIALGRGPQSSGDYTMAVGWGSVASGFGSNAIGYLASASGEFSTALGISTLSSNSYTTALGGWTKSTGYATFAAGVRSEASGWTATSFGYETRANGAYQLAVGYWNIAQGNSYTPAPTDSLFIVGNGTDNEHRSNAFAVNHNGDTTVSGNLSVSGTGQTTINGNLKVNGIIRVEQAGDISMGDFKTSPQP